MTMKTNTVIMTLLTFLLAGGFAMAQEQEEKSLEERCEEEADRLQRALDLEDWQVFYVDSILKHDYNALKLEYDALQQSRVTNATLYEMASDKWMDKMDSAYYKVFTEEQWNKYLKQGAGRAQKARAKRRAQAEGTDEGKKKKNK